MTPRPHPRVRSWDGSGKGVNPLPNLFIGFPVSRAKFAEVAGRAPGIQLPFDDYYFTTFFDSLDGVHQQLQGSATIIMNYQLVQLLVTINNGDSAHIRKYPSYPLVPMDWAKKRTFRTRCKITSDVDSTISVWISTGNINLFYGVGFYFNAGRLYARTKNAGGTTDVEIANLGLAGFAVTYDLKVVFSPADNAEFYLDGSLVATITTNLPTGISYASRLYYIRISNYTGTDSGKLELSQVDVYQKA